MLLCTAYLLGPGKLLALCEGGFPMEVDFATLRTKGEVDFGLKKLGAMGTLLPFGQT